MNLPTLSGAEPRTSTGVPLVGGLGDLKDSDGMSLVLVLADLVEALCVVEPVRQAREAAAA